MNFVWGTYGPKSINKINGKLKFLYCKNKFITPTLGRMLCSPIIKSHFGYACSVWYPKLNEKLKKKIQLTGCLSIKRVHQCINVITFKFVNNACPRYLNEVYEYDPQCRIESRSNFAKLKVPFRKTNMGHSYIGLSVWNNLPGSMKKTTALNTFKDNLKKQYFGNLAGS